MQCSFHILKCTFKTFQMPLLRERFRRTGVTDNGSGKLLFVIIVSIPFLIMGVLETLSNSVSHQSKIVPASNHSNDHGRRYCDPPNMTTVYYDLSEETNDDYGALENQELIAESSISWIDMQNEKASILLDWGVTLSFFPAYFLTIKYEAKRVFLCSFLFVVTTLPFYDLEPDLRPIRSISCGLFMGFLLFSFYQMVYKFASSGRNTLISFASVRWVGLALGELLLLFTVKRSYVFYTIAVITIGWFIFWWKIQFTCHRNQILHDKEKRRHNGSKSKIPWKDMLRSRPVWMTISVIFGASCGLSCILKAMKKYLQFIYFLEVTTINAVSSLLHVGFAISCGFFLDYLLKARIVSVTSSRRMITYLSHFIPAGLLFVLGFVGCGLTTPIVLYCLSIMTTGANYTGAFCSPLDLAPKHSGFILALCFTFGSFGNLLMDHLILYILTNQVFVSWRFIFSLNSLILLLTAIFFMLRGSGSVQPWNDSDKPKGEINKCVQRGKVFSAAPIQKPRTKSIYMVEKKILKVLHVQEPDKFTRVRAYSTSLPNERSSANSPNIYRPSNKKRASIS